MPDINAGKLIQFTQGSIITITPAGGSAVTLKNIAGGFSWTPPVRATLAPDIDLGVMNELFREGDPQVGSLALDIKATVDQGSTEFYEIMTAASANGYVPNMDIAIQIPDFIGAATGISYTATKAARSEAPTHTQGDQHDTITGRWIFKAGAKAAY